MKYFLLMALLYVSVITYGQQSTASVARPDAHAPIGVMGDHTHARGEWMISYRFMTMYMQDSRIGTDDIAPEEIVTTRPTRFANPPMMPPTLRVVPLEMRMNMHMIGFMYAPSDRLTLMGMGMYVSNTMDHLTFQGPSGTAELGNFTTTSSGIGDTKVTALYTLGGQAHVSLGLNIPTGSIDEEDAVLAPTDMRPVLRLPYPMQIGSGTWDLLPGITYARRGDRTGWGAQASGTVRLGTNDNEYTYGDRIDITLWGSYLPLKWLSLSARTAWMSLGEVDGLDPQIRAPVQTAEPGFQGGQRLDVFIGFNVIGPSGVIRNHRVSAEFGLPVWQDLNGPQLKVAHLLTIGYQYAF